MEQRGADGIVVDADNEKVKALFSLDVNEDVNVNDNTGAIGFSDEIPVVPKSTPSSSVGEPQTVQEDLPDNIDDIDLTQEQIAMMMEDAKKADSKPKVAPAKTVADMYKEYLSGRGSVEWEEVDEITVGRGLDSLGNKFSATGRSSYLPSTTGYSRNVNFGKSTTSYSTRSREASPVSVVGEDELTEAVDRLTDKTYEVYDTVKATDTLITDLYEKFVTLNDTVESVEEHAKLARGGISAIERRMTLIEEAQLKILTKLEQVLAAVGAANTK